ncbi:MAG TPA: ABC transporter ATP-binding protein [Methanothermobacter sp.]|nr:sulfate-transporting ATPase [Methanothermobacter sp. MT-2]HHW05642.1 ABC transporter ATP-binding protein [Methanothermobacter sp.]HOK72742.1 ABC transporter ATP-binding protein [Methanothermobacter sp.]HOL68538.1 ABC transporter ATP-binding protein [Methanothermobacter sp.]HPQ04297.1 ABC transporter ATP-binding protein [Methanothermobacter sp.]
METGADHAIVTLNLTKKFGEFCAVNTLNLKVKKGEIYGLLGPNGAGKTTTIKMLCGISKATSGKAFILGKRVPDKIVAREIGYMPQETALYDNLTIEENLEFYGEIFNLKDDKIPNKIQKLLDFINLKDWGDELVRNLSGGMKHRVSLACALIHEPKILFLDEPTVGIDPELRVSFWDYFKQLKKSGKTILITTHYMDEARHCDRIGFMRAGKLIAEDKPQQMLIKTGTESLEDAFLKIGVGP